MSDEASAQRTEPRKVVLDAKLALVTPLFCAGATTDDVGFRASSVRGVLRWWWRALEYPRIFAGTRNQQRALRELAAKERGVFGGVGDRGQLDRGGQGQRSRVTCRVYPAVGHGATAKLDKGQLLTAGDRSVVGSGARYLGYGLMAAFGKDAGRLSRSCLVGAGTSEVAFRVQFVCEGLADDDVEALERALVAWGHLGGLGARSRRGWGSVALVGLEKQTVGLSPESTVAVPVGGLPTYDQLVEGVSQVLQGVPPAAEQWPPFSAFGPGARVMVAQHQSSPLSALDAVGAEMVRYRSWGHNGKILDGEPAEQNFPDDHDLMKLLGHRTRHPRRLVFGLPHNYGKGDDYQVAPVIGAGPNTSQRDKGDRRASPLLVHVHPLEDGSAAAVLTLLPAKFLPGSTPKAQVGRDIVDLQPLEELYKPLDEFLDRIGSHAKGGFTRAQDIRATTAAGRGPGPGADGRGRTAGQGRRSQ